MTRPKLTPRVVAVALCVLPACKDDDPEAGERLVAEMIGPAGGELRGSGVVLTVPPGALSTETMVELRAAGDDLSASNHRQSGTAYELFPAGHPLALPAELTFTSGPDDPAVLFRQDGMTVAGGGLTTYINEFNKFAVAEAGVRLTDIDMPGLAATPEAATVVHDAIPFSAQVTDTPRVNVVMTLYDFDDVHTTELNGVSSEGDCGFELDDVTGASLSAGCTEGPLTAQLRITGPNVEFTAVSFQAGKVNPAVPVGVIAGGTDLAYWMGFVAFDTSACYEEMCQGRGTCEVDAAGNGACVCEPGYATEPGDPFTCGCMPQCDGRECGPDGCGESCGGCGDGEFCADDVGICMDAGDPTTTGGMDPTTTGGMTDDTGDGSGSTGGSTTGGDSTTGA